MERTRYDILDGLRGVAALMVLLYHVFNDAKSFFVWPTPVNEFYHSFLGVDFFFILSGFVMGYAYDRQPKPIKGHVFLLCSLALAILLGFPSLGSKDANTIYQLVCILSFFPTIIWFGARGIVSGWRHKAVSFIGRLSYPLYATHFPLIYLYITWVGSDGHPYEGYSQPWVPALLTLVASVLIATLCLLFYDEPLRNWLNKKLHSTSRQYT